MKNTILGWIGCLILLYGAIIALSINACCLRRNEMDRSVSAVCRSILEEYYRPVITFGSGMEYRAPGISDAQAEELLVEELRRRLEGKQELKVKVLACNMEMGIISVEVSEEFELPAGTEKTITARRTILVDRAVEEERHE